MLINLKPSMGNLFHCSNHISCSSRVSILEPGLRGSVGYRPDGGWVGLCGHRGWYSSVLVQWGWGCMYSMRLCNTRNSVRCNLICHKTCIHVNFLHLFLVHCIYLGEEVKAAQAADDAVDLRKPSAFTAGLRTARKKKTGSKHLCVTRLLIQVQPQD